MASSSSGAIPTCVSYRGKKHRTVVNVTVVAIVQIKTPISNKSKHNSTKQQNTHQHNIFCSQSEEENTQQKDIIIKFKIHLLS